MWSTVAQAYISLLFPKGGLICNSQLRNINQLFALAINHIIH